MKYRKKPVEVDAVQWDGTNIDEIIAFMRPVSPVNFVTYCDTFQIPTVP